LSSHAAHPAIERKTTDTATVTASKMSRGQALQLQCCLAFHLQKICGKRVPLFSGNSRMKMGRNPGRLGNGYPGMKCLVYNPSYHLNKMLIATKHNAD